MTKDLTPYRDAIHREVIAPALEALKQRLLDGVVRGPVEVNVSAFVSTMPGQKTETTPATGFLPQPKPRTRTY